MMDKKLTIVIDFDGTITNYSPYPIMGSLNKDAKKYIPLLYKQNFNLILFTARSGQYYKECLQFLKDNDLYQYFNFSNDYLKGETGKPVALYYIDDRAVPEKLDWCKTYEFIIKTVGEMRDKNEI